MLRREDIDQNVYDAAIDRATHTLETFDHVFVLFSGGKDSTVAMNVMLDAAHLRDDLAAKHLPLRVIFFDEEGIPQETEDYVRRTSQRPDVNLEWLCIPVRARNACSRKEPWWYPWAPEAEDKWCRPLPPEAITEIPGFPIWPVKDRLSTSDTNGLFAPPELGNTAAVMGIRAQESHIRSKAVRGKTVDNYIMAYTDKTSNGNLWKVYPVYDWTAQDIWTGVREEKWDYNEAYDLQWKAGVQENVQRVSPPFGEQSNGSLHLYAKCYPDIWAKLCERVPGAAAAARWTLTELYGFKKRPPKPEDMSWPQYLAHYVAQFNLEERKLIAERLRSEIALHYKKTTHPIMPLAHHPASGCSWDTLALIAMRGDFRNRTQFTLKVQRDETGRPKQRMWDKYKAALEDAIDSGKPPSHWGHPGDWPDPEHLVDYAFRADYKDRKQDNAEHK